MVSHSAICSFVKHDGGEVPVGVGQKYRIKFQKIACARRRRNLKGRMLCLILQHAASTDTPILATKLKARIDKLHAQATKLQDGHNTLQRSSIDSYGHTSYDGFPIRGTLKPASLNDVSTHLFVADTGEEIPVTVYLAKCLMI